MSENIKWFLFIIEGFSCFLFIACYIVLGFNLAFPWLIVAGAADYLGCEVAGKYPNKKERLKAILYMLILISCIAFIYYTSEPFKILAALTLILVSIYGSKRIPQSPTPKKLKNLKEKIINL